MLPLFWTHVIQSRFCLVPNFDETLSFPGEDCAHSFFKDLPSNLTTQNDIQASVNVWLFPFQPQQFMTKLVCMLLLILLGQAVAG